MIKNQAGQSIGAQMVNASTGAAFVGAVTAYVTIDAGDQAIGTTGSGVCTSEGNGYFTYAPSAAETTGDLIAFTFIGSGAVPVTVQVATVTASQVGALATATGLLAVPITTIITDAFAALNIYGAVELPSPEDAAFALGKLNTIFDDWNAEPGKAVYADQFITGTLVPSLSPHTIGPTGTFVVTQRPVSITFASWVNNGVYTPIGLLDAEGYDAIPMPGLTGIQNGLYYNKTWPNGELYFYPVPVTPYAVILTTRVVLGQVLLSDTFSMPPGYRSAVTLTLEEALVPAFPGSQASGDLSRGAAKARSRIFSNNVTTPRLMTQDAGMPSGQRAGSSWDFRTGTYR